MKSRAQDPAAVITAQEVVVGLGGHMSGRSAMVNCPAHDDRNPSLSVSEGRDGTVLVHCHGGCSQEAVIDALRGCGLWTAAYVSKQTYIGLPRERDAWTPILPVPSEVLPKKSDHPKHGTPVARWCYRDVDGNTLGFICRWNEPGNTKKIILPQTFCRDPDGRREWRWQGFPAPRPLYGLDQLAQHPHAPVLIVEGEKAADAARELFSDMVVITWPHGAKSVSKADWRPLGERSVTIWPDADPEGQSAARAVARACVAAGTAEIRIVDLPSTLPL